MKSEVLKILAGFQHFLDLKYNFRENLLVN